MTIVETHAFLDDMCEKTQTGFSSPVKKDRLLERAQMAVFAMYNSQFVETGFIHAALEPFRRVADWVTADDGQVFLPTDWEFTSGIYGISWDNAQAERTYPQIRILKDDEVGLAMASQLRKPSANFPIAYYAGNGVIQLQPTALYAGKVHIIRKPKAPVFNFTLTGRQPVYNPTGSQDLEWSDTHVGPVLMKALEMLGINLNAPAVTQWAASKAANNLGGDKV